MFDFKGLIRAIMRKKSDDPVGDLKSATIWVQELPQSDMHRALQEILKALARLNKNPSISLKERFRVLTYLDEKARPLQDELCRGYMACADNPTLAARQQRVTILQFWDAMADAYYNFLRAYTKNPKGKIHQHLPLLTAKALHFHAMQVKWSYLRYLPVETHVWRHLGRLYTFAESGGFQDSPVSLYPGQEPTTCGREYLQPMMLHLANPASLLPAQIEMVDVWLDAWSSSLVIEKECRPHRQLYAVNLGDMKPARKLRSNMSDEKYRYWGVALLLLTISQTVSRLKEGEAPARLKLGEACRLPACLDLIEDVAKRWSGESTQRRHERVTANRPLMVVEGLGGIISQLQDNTKTRLPDAPHHAIGLPPQPLPAQKKTAVPPRQGESALFKPGLRKWLMHDESAEGLGASFATEGGERLAIGTLLGLKKAGGKQYAIGIVRRINRESSEKIHAGIQIWSQTPLTVALSETVPDSGAVPVTAIYLPESPRLGMGRSLLMPSHAYSPGKQVRIQAQGKSYTIRLQQAAEQSTDYTRTGFVIVPSHGDTAAAIRRGAPS